MIKIKISDNLQVIEQIKFRFIFFIKILFKIGLWEASHKP